MAIPPFFITLLMGTQEAEARGVSPRPAPPRQTPRPTTQPIPGVTEYLPPSAQTNQTPASRWSLNNIFAPPVTSNSSLPDDLILIVEEGDDFYEYYQVDPEMALDLLTPPSVTYLSQRNLGEVRVHFSQTGLSETGFLPLLPDSTELSFPGEIYEGARDKFYQTYPGGDWVNNSTLRWRFLLQELDHYLEKRIGKLAYTQVESNYTLGSYRRDHEGDGVVIQIPGEPWGVEDLLIIYAEADRNIWGLEGPAQLARSGIATDWIRGTSEEVEGSYQVVSYGDLNDPTRSWEEAQADFEELKKRTEQEEKIVRRKEEGVTAHDLEKELGELGKGTLSVKGEKGEPVASSEEEGTDKINGTLPADQSEEEGNIGAVVKEVRWAKGMTQKELGEVVGVDDSYISDIETSRGNPSNRLRAKLEEALDLEEGTLGRVRLFEERIGSLSLGEFIRTQRRAKGMTQQKLGEAVGTSRASISHIETGYKRPLPPLRWRLERALGLEEGRLGGIKPLEERIGPPTLGEVIRTLRGEKGMMQKELGEAVGTSEAYIGQIETGRRNPSNRLRAKLEEALDLEEGTLGRVKPFEERIGPLTLGEVIQTLREGRGMTQRELGEAVGMSRIHISQIETGYKNPSNRLRAKLEEALDLEEGTLGRVKPFEERIGPLTLGEVIRTLRGEKGMTQQELGEAVSTSRAYIGQIETSRENPSNRLRAKLEEAFGLEEGALGRRVNPSPRRRKSGKVPDLEKGALGRVNTSPRLRRKTEEVLEVKETTPGELIRSAREAKRMTMEGLAGKIKVNRIYLYRIEKGEAEPSAYLRRRIENVLGLEEGSLDSFSP